MARICPVQQAAFQFRDPRESVEAFSHGEGFLAAWPDWNRTALPAWQTGSSFATMLAVGQLNSWRSRLRATPLHKSANPVASVGRATGLAPVNRLSTPGAARGLRGTTLLSNPNNCVRFSNTEGTLGLIFPFPTFGASNLDYLELIKPVRFFSIDAGP